jgi:hypothetical protein
MAYGHTSDATAVLLLENTRIGVSLSNENHNRYSQSTIRAVVHVNTGQRVMARNSGHDADYHAGVNSGYTAFTGVLIKAD